MTRGLRGRCQCGQKSVERPGGAAEEPQTAQAGLAGSPATLQQSAPRAPYSARLGAGRGSGEAPRWRAVRACLSFCNTNTSC